MARRDTQEDFLRKAQEKFPNMYDYSKVEYKGSKVPVTIICPTHGDFVVTPGNHLNNSNGCAECVNDSRRITWEEFINRANAVHDNKFQYPEEIPFGELGIRSRVRIVCPEHGEFTQVINGHINLKHGCKKCGSDGLVKSVTREEFIERAEKVHKGKYLYLYLPDVMERLHYTKGVFTCMEHGNFHQTYAKHLKGQGCPRCADDVVPRTLTLELAVERARRVHGDRYTYLSMERGGQYPITYLCPDHGEFTQSLYSHLKGIGCAMCSKSTSTQHLLVMSWLDELGVPYEVNNRTILRPRELDIYIPEHNIAIEIDGEFWHTHAKKEDRHYHYNKFKDCEKAGVRLMSFWAKSEIDEKREIVKSMIMNALGKTPHTIYARQTTVGELDSRTYRGFMQEHHLEGGAKNSSVKLGLFYKGELVSAMGFSRKKGGWELDRYVTKKFTNVVGGFSKLMKNAPKGKIVSYSFNSYSYGEVYSRYGFRFDRENKTTLYYLHEGQLKNRNNFMKYKCIEMLGLKKDDPRTERELALLLGAEQVFSAGTRTWVLDNT